MTVFYAYTDDGTSRILYYWNTTTKAVETVTTGTGGAASSFLGNFVDAYQSGPNVMLRTGNISSLNLLDTYTYPGATLLSISNDAVNAQVVMYNLASRVTTTVAVPMVIFTGTGFDIYSPVNNLFTISSTALVDSFCLGTTKVDKYYISGSITSINHENSTDCGFSAVASGIILTETKVIKIDHSCHDQPVVLRWKNTLGGWDQYMFEYDQQTDLVTQDLAAIKSYQADISLSTNNAFDLGKNAAKTIALGADALSNDDYNGIVPDLLVSPAVYIVQPSGSGLKDTLVKISPGSFSTLTRYNSNSLEFQILLPEIQTVRN